jgi:HEAT repeat protein
LTQNTPLTAQHTLLIIIARLADYDSDVRRASLAALGELGEQAVEHAGTIAERLEDEYSAVREAAVQTLGNMEDNAVPHAVARLEHDEANVRVAALQVLGALGGKHAAAHVEAIAARLRDDVVDVQLAAHVVLTALKVLGALPATQSAALAEFDAEFNSEF